MNNKKRKADDLSASHTKKKKLNDDSVWINNNLIKSVKYEFGDNEYYMEWYKLWSELSKHKNI